MSNKNFFVHSQSYRRHESRRLLSPPTSQIQVRNSDLPESFIDQILSSLGSSDFIGQILIACRAAQGGTLAIGNGFGFDRGKLPHFQRLRARFALMPVAVGIGESSPSQPPSIIYQDANVAGINHSRESLDGMIGNRFMLETVNNASVPVKAGTAFWSRSITYFPGGAVVRHTP